MPRVARAALFCLLLLALLAARPSVAAPSGAEDGDAAGFARARAWFEGLGYPDVRSRPFVRVWTGAWWSTTDGQGNRRVVLEPELGWLMAENGDRFRVFTTELRIDRFRRREVPDRPEDRVTYDRIELADTVREGLAALARLAAFEKAHPGAEDPPSPIWKETDPFGDTRRVPPLRFKGYVLACACAQAGHDDLALALWHRLAAQAPWPAKDAWNVVAGLKHAIGHEARRNLVIEAGSQEGSWVEHLAAHRRWLERFPGHAEMEGVRADVVALESTARTEAARRQAEKPHEHERTDAERADDLVARLSEPCAFLLEPIDGDVMKAQGTAVPPLEAWVLPRLIAFGRTSVPRLIEALTDDRWTRSVSVAGGPSKGWIRDEPYVERVADLALVALGAIAREDFSGEGRIGRRAFLRGPDASILTKGGAGAAQAKARAWWEARAKRVGPENEK